MTQIQLNNAAVSSGRVPKFGAFLYGVVAYAAFLVTVLYAIGFVGDYAVPKTVDSGRPAPVVEALIVNLLLMSLFAVQHSVMARKPFKQWWTQYVPKSVERSTYVLLASLCLLLLFWQWIPIPAIVWQIDEPDVAATVAVIGMAGWVIVFTSTFMINHFELFGLHQVASNLSGTRDAGAAIQDAAVLQFREASDLSRLHHRVLGGSSDDGRPFVVRGGNHRLHLRRHLARGTRPG